jgi:hypothetical protein
MSELGAPLVLSAGLVLFLTITIGVLVIVVLSYWTMSTLIYRASGWSRLAQAYGVTSMPYPIRLYRRGNIRVGKVRWRRSVTIAITTEGLYLGLRAFARSYPPVLIPWPAIVEVTDTKLYWVAAKELHFAAPQSPPVTIQMEVFQETQGYLKLEGSY